MELVSVVIARAVWFVNARDINPRGLNLWHTFLPTLTEKYKFIQYPKEMSLDLQREAGDRFVGGTYKNTQGANILINFTSFDDGMVAETRSSTQDSEAFLEEISQWIGEFGLVFRPEMVRRKGYVSELIVKSEYRLNALNPKLEKFAARLSKLTSGERLSSLPSESFTFETSGLVFTADGLGLKPSPFRFERENDTLFSENKYYSQAPLQTDTHLELLNELEQILSS
ncbi:MAG: hypothetical protein AB1757_13185 [Acidobacteriota bacterium]